MTDKMFAESGTSTCSLTVDARLPESALHSQVRGVCKALLSSWAEVDDSIVSVTKVTGGISNLMLKAELANGELPAVTVRVFGPNSDTVIDRDRELQALPYISSAGFGAKLLGVFGNGTVQSFLVGKTLDQLDMAQPKMAKLIAAEVRRLNGLEVPGSREPRLWQDLHKFIDRASGISFQDSEKQKAYETISFDKIRADVEEIKAVGDRLKSPVVFAHNDLLCGNFMYNEDDGKMHIIDFEHAAYGFRGHDIGNFLNEHAGFDCDYSLYPGKEKQYYFFRHYLHPESATLTTDAELEEMYVECNFYTLSSHLYWALWAVIQAKISSIDFDYLRYFFQRFAEYKRRKEEMIALALNYVNKQK